MLLEDGQLVVNSATAIAQNFGVSEKVIALTIVAIGTSLPELVTSVIAARKNETDLAIGNVVGSNIFNILFILGISSVISPLTIDFTAFIDIIVMSVTGVIVFALLKNKNEITKRKGILLLVMYFAYLAYILIR